VEDHFDPCPSNLDRWVPKPHIVEDVERFLDALLKGDNPTLFTPLPKIEVLSIAKILAGKIRKFCADNIIGKLVTRMLLGACIDLHNNQRPLLNPAYVTCVGINMAGRDTALLYSRHAAGKHRHLDADIKQCDSSHRDTQIGVVYRLTAGMIQRGSYWVKRRGTRELEDYLARVKQCLYLMVHANVVVGDWVYEYSCGMPSGNPATTYINDLTVSSAVRISAARVLGERFSNFKELHEVFVTSHYGDDIIISWHETLPITGPALVTEMFSLGYTMTSGDKSEIMPDWKALDDCSFLKRKFTVLQGCIRMAVELDSILQSLMWTSRKATSRGAFPSTIRNFWLNLVLHGRATYDKYFTIVSPVLEQAGFSGQSLAYEDALQASGFVDGPTLVDHR
jgi:hypothetical protein